MRRASRSPKHPSSITAARVTSTAGLWTSGGAYDTLADSQIFEIDNGNINYGDGYGVVNLTPATSTNCKSSCSTIVPASIRHFPLQFQQVNFTGSADEFVPQDPAPPELGYMEGITIGGAGTTQANGEIATIYFSIDEGFNGIFVNSWDGGASTACSFVPFRPCWRLQRNGSVGPEDYDVWRETSARRRIWRPTETVMAS